MKMKRFEFLGEIVAIMLSGMVFLTAFAVIGCDNAANPIQPLEKGTTTMGNLKSTSTSAAVTEVEGVEIIAVYSAVAAPSIVETIEVSDDLAVVLSHKKTDDGEIIIISASGGAMKAGDKVRFYVNDEYTGRVTIADSAEEIAEIHIHLDDEDLNVSEGEVTVEVEISRDGSVTAEAEIEINRTPIVVGPQVETVEVGDNADEIVITFSEYIDAHRAIKSNFKVVNENGEEVRIRSYGADGSKVTLIMAEDLVVGEEYVLTYNGEDGLEDLDGEDVAAFEVTLTVGAAVAPVVAPADDAVWRTIPHGVYASGDEILAIIEPLYAVSRWTKEIMGTVVFPVEQSPGNTDLYRIRIDTLGITGPLTMQKIIDAVTASNEHALAHPETPSILRAMYLEQPFRESLAVATPEMSRPGVRGKTYGLYLGGGNERQPRQNINAVESSAILDPAEFEYVVVKRV